VPELVELAVAAHRRLSLDVRSFRDDNELVGVLEAEGGALFQALPDDGGELPDREGILGMRMMSAKADSPPRSASHPEWRPITSRKKIVSWDSAVWAILSALSQMTFSAVS